MQGRILSSFRFQDEHPRIGNLNVRKCFRKPQLPRRTTWKLKLGQSTPLRITQHFFRLGRRSSQRDNDPPPPARRGQGVPNSLRTLTIFFDFANSKSSSGSSTGVPPTLSAESPFSYLRLNFPYIFHFWGRSTNHQKSDLYQILPKAQKSVPWVLEPKARFWIHFG